MKEFLLNTMLRKLEKSDAKEGQKLVSLMTEEEFKTEAAGIPHKKTLLHNMTQMEYCKAELFGSCVLGTLSLPVLKDRVEGRVRFGFYLSETRLYLVGDVDQLARLVGRMKENQFPEELSIPGFFCYLLNSWIDGDVIFLQKTEDALSALEEGLLEKIPDHFYKMLIPYRKDLMALHSYYYQLINLGVTIRSNTNQMLSDEECLVYGYFSDRAERLHSHVEALREYVLQIREMHQTQIQVKQTKTMNLLTVVSAIFLPLTLLVGWYGMNFIYMPELRWVFGYPGVFVVAVLIVCIEIILFKKKKLL